MHLRLTRANCRRSSRAPISTCGTGASPSSAERNLTAAITKGLGDVRDVEASYDGRKLLFALHEPNIVGASPDEQPTWDIWEYDLDSQLLRRVFTSDTAAREGDDVAPHYLPDGRIVFSSTRQRQAKAILLDEGKPQFAAQDESDNEHAFVLHVMNADGSGIRQVSFNQSHDLDPAVLDDGRIVFSRWDHAPGHDEISLYAMRPTVQGSSCSTARTATQPARTAARSTSSTRGPWPMAGCSSARSRSRPRPRRPAATIDVANYVEDAQPTLPNRGVLTGPAQLPATINDITDDRGPSPGGRFLAHSRCGDGTGRLLFTWTQCRLLERHVSIVPCTPERLAATAATPAPPLYGVWIYDPA